MANLLSDEFEVLWSKGGDSPASHQLSAAVERVPQGSIADLAFTVASCGMFVGNNSGPMNIDCSFTLNRPVSG